MRKRLSEYSMSSKVAVITGGGQGLGKAFAESLLERNYKIALLDINAGVGNATSSSFNRRYGSGRSLFIKCDVRDRKQIADAFQKAEHQLGKIDIVINNAGITDEDEWSRTIQINFNGVVDGTYTAVDHLRKDLGGKGGVVVNIASTAGLTAVPIQHVYVGTKHAVVGFSRSVAATCELLKDKWGISVLCLCPSYTDTEMIKREVSGKSPITPSELFSVSRSYIQQIGVNKVSTVVDAFQRLLSDNVNGAVMAVTPRGKQYRFPHKLRTSKL